MLRAAYPRCIDHESHQARVYDVSISLLLSSVLVNSHINDDDDDNDDDK